MANVTVTLTGDEARLLRSLDKIVQKERQVAREATRTGESSKRASRGVNTEIDRTKRGLDGVSRGRERAFGAGAVAQIAKYASAFALATTAANELKAAVLDVAEANERAGRAQQAAARGLSSLAQLAATEEDFQRLVKVSREVFRGGRVPSLDAAANLVFRLESAGILEEGVGLFDKLSGILTNPASVASAVAALQTSLGADETGTVRQIVSKGFAASGGAPAEVEQILQQAARAAPGAKFLGLSDEELLAAVAIASKGLGGPEEGGTAVGAFLSALATKGGFEGIGLDATLQKIADLDLPTTQLETFAGGKRGVRALSILSGQRLQFGNILSAVREAEFEDLGGERAQFLRGVPEIQGAFAANQARAQRELAEVRQGILQNVSEAALLQFEARARLDPRRSELMNAFRRRQLRLVRALPEDVGGGPRAVLGALLQLQAEGVDTGVDFGALVGPLAGAERAQLEEIKAAVRDGTFEGQGGRTLQAPDVE